MALGWLVDHWRQVANCEEHSIVYEQAVREMEEWVNELGNYGIELEFGREGVTGVIQNCKRLTLGLPIPSAPAPNPPNP